MANTLYDLLEVNQSASTEAITAGYKRLQAKFAALSAGGDEDATNQLVALREALNTLSDPGRRQRYDASLAARESVAEPAGRPFLKVLLIAVLIGGFGLGYQKYRTEQERLRLETERAVAAAKLAEIEAQKAADEKLAAEQAEQQLRREQAIERANRERDITYGQQVSRRLEWAEADARRAKQREEQQRLYEERQQQNEAAGQLAREKAYLRQLEAEKSRYSRY